jgi:hypothetical protein
VIGRTPWRRLSDDHFAIDRLTAERLVHGELAPDDAPPEYRQVAATVQRLRRNATQTELADREYAVQSIVEELTAVSAARAAAVEQREPRRGTGGLKVVAASCIAGLSLTVGLGMAGALPDGAQEIMSGALGQVGISAPSPTGPSHAPPKPEHLVSSVGASAGGAGGAVVIESPTPTTAVVGVVPPDAPSTPGAGSSPGPTPSGSPGRSDQHGKGTGGSTNPGTGTGGVGNGGRGANGNGASNGVGHTHGANAGGKGHS